MILDDARGEIEERFCGVSIDPISPRKPDSVIVCSGALGIAGQPPPILCATQDLAIELFRRTLNDYVDDVTQHDAHKRILTWITEPQILKFVMTIQEVSTAHRVASSRYAVYSVLVIGEAEDVPAIAFADDSDREGPEGPDVDTDESDGAGEGRAAEPKRRPGGKSRKGPASGSPGRAPAAAPVLPAEQD